MQSQGERKCFITVMGNIVLAITRAPTMCCRCGVMHCFFVNRNGATVCVECDRKKVRRVVT